MARTQSDFLNIVLKAQCCAADMAYKALKQEMFLKADAIPAFKNVRYIQALISILNRYYDTIYVLEDIESCISSSQVEDIIQEVAELCDQCGCCTDAQAIIKDI